MIHDDGVPPEVKKKIIAVISALIPEAKIYIYGSRAQGTFERLSDIDLALDAGQKIEPHGRVSEVKSVLRELSIIYMVDVVDINNISDDFRNDILGDLLPWKN